MSLNPFIGWKVKRSFILIWLWIMLNIIFLSEADAAFNLSVFYGKDANWAEVVNACSRYPMFAHKAGCSLKRSPADERNR
ncbi:MAG: hypothetical protein WKF59_21105 [Chitinophagaceae bacterium]